MKIQDVDTNSDSKIDTKGYYLDDSGNFRLIYNESDNNLDGISDFFVWMGSSPAPKKEVAIKDVVKVHEEEDSDFDGKIDILKWYLPNELIALTQVDKDKDGYFETTNYFNFKKQIVRTEIDTDFDGRADVYLWDNRAEIDTDKDGIPDKFTTAPSKLLLQDKLEKKIDLNNLNKSNSWLLYPNQAPIEQRAIIGSGYF
jgi:antitoxin component YwqK of YwqJK toxin-antitoxin module